MNNEKLAVSMEKEINTEKNQNLQHLEQSLFPDLEQPNTDKLISLEELASGQGSIEEYLDSLLKESAVEEKLINPVVKETLEILDTLSYRYEGIKVRFPDFYDYNAVEVLSPQTGSELLREKLTQYPQKPKCSYSVTNQDSFEAASAFDYPMVLNFANAYTPGGGFMGGSIAQEECLCRNSTLYNSISSDKAAEMYQYNFDTNKPLVTDYMLYSPNVCVFRDKNGALMKRPFLVAVTTAPAPNRMKEAMFEKDEAVNGTMKRRIRILLRNAIKHGHDSVVLGAWGCGVFGNEPKDVATCFRDVLVKEGYDKYFSNVNFAIFGKENSDNILGFKEIFAQELGLDKKQIQLFSEQVHRETAEQRKPAQKYRPRAKSSYKSKQYRNTQFNKIGQKNNTKNNNVEHDGR